MRQDHPRRNTPDTGRTVFPRHVKTALFQSQRGKCRYCGRLHRIGYLEIDHKWPVSRGGGNEMANLQLLCVPCNMRKGIQTDEEFRDRYWRLLPGDSGIPDPAVSQEVFADETQRTRASHEVRGIYHRRFAAHRGFGWRRRRRGGCGAAGAFIALAVMAAASNLFAT